VTELDVRVADWDDVDQIAKVIAGAFFHLEASEWLIPDTGWRKAVYHTFFRLAYVEPALTTGRVYCTADRMAAAVWLPVNGAPDPDPALDAALEQLTGPYHKHFAEFDRLLAEAHEPHLTTPHDFLGVIGAHPTVWGQGNARALMRQHLRCLDEQRRPSYLEAANARLVEVWGKFGYRPTDRVITLPNGHRMFPMWREPEAGPPG
jgi:GNAT superfamily N-acetyltransferase